MGFFKRLFIVLLLLSLATCKTNETERQQTFAPGKKAKNVILMIGDGMGLAQISAAMYSNKNRHALEKFPVIGLHKQHSYNDLITDSAAGATAFACGVKTYNNAIGLTADTVPCYTILEEAEANQLATGLVATSTIVHATPAAFIAHQPTRVLYERIANDFLDTEIDFLVGGGKKYFDRRDDERDLIQAFEEKGYNVYDYFNDELQRVSINPLKNFIFFTADKQPLGITAGRNYLPYASLLATKFLSKHSDKGFFLMIEGSQIDWAGHANDSKMLIKEALDFERAIAEVLSFARKRGDTLVIVTADHETGGYSILEGNMKRKVTGAFTSNDHTAAMIPVFAFGPSSELFAGIYENTDIHTKMRQALGFSSTQARGSVPTTVSK
ncbi:MAG: alkaline phosphatase [Bacteroidota bacterium]